MQLNDQKTNVANNLSENHLYIDMIRDVYEWEFLSEYPGLTTFDHEYYVDKPQRFELSSNSW